MAQWRGMASVTDGVRPPSAHGRTLALSGPSSPINGLPAVGGWEVGLAADGELMGHDTGIFTLPHPRTPKLDRGLRGKGAAASTRTRCELGFISTASRSLSRCLSLSPTLTLTLNLNLTHSSARGGP